VALANRDRAALARLIREFAPARIVDDALISLGELELERGSFAAAERAWRRASPAANPALHAARLQLLQLLRHRFEGFPDALAAFRRDHPKATGYLAGQEGVLGDRLQAVYDIERNAVEPPDVIAEDWTTFQAEPSRNADRQSPLPLRFSYLNRWKTRYPADGADRNAAPSVMQQHPRTMAFHPVVLGNTAFIADAARVTAFDLLTGESTILHDVRKGRRIADLSVQFPPERDARHTLTLGDGMLFARLGTVAFSEEEPRSFLVGIGPIKANRDKIADWDAYWHLTPPDPLAIWEGAPIVLGDRLYATYSRMQGDRLATAIACYTGLNQPNELPELVWQRDLCESSIEGTGTPAMRHELLTIAESNVVYLSHTGVMMALDLDQGKPVWALRYRRNETTGYRDLNPAVYADGRLYMAPNDSDGITCVDAFTGRVIWERGELDVVQLMGVSSGRIGLATGGDMKGIRALHADDGRNDWIQHDGGGLTTLGRGLLVDDTILWPTRFGIYSLQTTTGQPNGPPIPEVAGNLVWAQGVLLVATGTELMGYVSDRKQLAARQQAIQVHPEDDRLRSDYADALADAQQLPRAATEWQRLVTSPQTDLVDHAQQQWGRYLLASRQAPVSAWQAFRATTPPASWRAEAEYRLQVPPEQLRQQLTDPRQRQALRIDGHGFPSPIAFDWVDRLDPTERMRIATMPAWETRDQLRLQRWWHRVVPPAEIDRAQLLVRLARSYESDYPDAARATWQRLAHEHGELKLPMLDDKLAVAQWVAQHLKKLPINLETPTLPTMTIPLLAREPIDTGEAWPLLHDGKQLIAASATSLDAFDLESGTLAWRVPTPFIVEEVVADADRWIGCGPSGMIAINRSGQLIWIWDVVGRDVTLSAFRTTPGRMAFRWNETRLILIDTETGLVDWSVTSRSDALGIVVFEAMGQITAKSMIWPLSNGSRWLFDLATGRVLHQQLLPEEAVLGAASSRNPWVQAPIVLDAERVIIGSNAQNVECINARSGRTEWSQKIAGARSLTGRCPELRREGRFLLVLIERNFGWQLDCLDVETGRKLWPAPIDLGIEPVELDALIRWKQSLIVPIGSRLFAYDLLSGRPQWQRESNIREPQLFAFANTILITSRQSNGHPFGLPLTDRLRWSPKGVGWALRAWYDGLNERSALMRMVDPRDGQTLQEFMWAVRGTRVEMIAGPQGAVLASAGQARWLK